MVSVIIPGAEDPVAVSAGNFNGLPQIAALSDGSYVVTWTGTDADGNGQFAQRYSAAGVAIGGIFQANTFTAHAQRDGVVTALGDGGFIITWASGGQDHPEGDIYLSDGGIYAQRYDADGNTVGGETLINTVTEGDQREPAATALSDGGYVISWTSYGPNADNGDIIMQRYDAAGAKVGGEVRANTFTTNHQQEASIASLSDGGWIVTWSSYLQDGDQYGAYYQRYDAAGAKVGIETRVSVHGGGYQMETSVTGLANGGYVITFRGTEPVNGFYDHMYQRIYDSTGHAVTSDIQVNTFSNSNQDQPSVTALSDGGWIVVWSSYNQQGQGVACYGQRFDSDGNKLGGELLLNSTQTNDQIYAVVTALADGGFAVAWESNQTGTYGVYQKAYVGGGGDLSGTQYVYGGAGNDTLDGGAGADYMYGGKGDDTYTVDNAGDVVTEATGQGNDTILSSVSYGLSGVYVETLRLTGSANINATGNSLDNILYGNSGANTLTGGAGNDTLNGGGGADTMIGGAGDDTYRVDNTGDIVTEASGQGTDSVVATISYDLTGSFIENLQLGGTNNLNATGNSLDNNLLGNSGVNMRNAIMRLGTGLAMKPTSARRPREIRNNRISRCLQAGVMSSPGVARHQTAQTTKSMDNAIAPPACH